ncbi:endonuclease [Halobacillus sp. ACCC02827]|uniref:endonuclease n=1 Tax=unclassified Halobacillus TaxID=2636472 RepID=UPI0007867D72|nr:MULTISPECIES: endonuclease [unclassified Halobacillus]WJE16472.1 endonuclease [Halobacillus sp. ACCC02827]
MKKQIWLIVSFLFLIVSPPAFAATSLTISEGMEMTAGSDVKVEGYIVGVPVGVDKVEQNSFTSNYALALADEKEENATERMLFVKLDSEYRGSYGLENNPDLMGEKVIVEGSRDDYFAHPGVKSVSSIALAGEEGDGETGEQDSQPGSYYDRADSLTGDALKAELHDIIDDHTEISYSQVWDALRNTDEDPENPANVLLLYTGDSISKNRNGGGVDDWNREHVWAKSHGGFGTAMGAGTDLHHLRPTDVSVNSSRSNLDFDNGGSPYSDAPDTYYDGDSWEPRDEVKGDVARMIFYMAVRYEGDQGELDLEVADFTGTSGPYLGKLSTLKEWHESDPVDDFERNRNEVIYEDYQHNRNPFIDHPEYVEEIW